MVFLAGGARTAILKRDHDPDKVKNDREPLGSSRTYPAHPRKPVSCLVAKRKDTPPITKIFRHAIIPRNPSSSLQLPL